MTPLVVLNGYNAYDSYGGSVWCSRKVTYFRTEAGQLVRQAEYVRRVGWLERKIHRWWTGNDREEVACVDSEPLSDANAIRRLEVEADFRYEPEQIAKWLKARPLVETPGTEEEP